MARGLSRLLATTVLLAIAAIALGLLAYYLLKPSPYRQVASIDPRVSPPDLLRNLSMNRVVPGRFGPHILVGSNTIERAEVHDRLFGRVSYSELVTRLFVHSRATYSSSPVIVPLTIELRRFPDPLQARIALLEMMIYERSVRNVSNPVKGHIYTSHGWPEVYRWVDGVWLAKLEAYNRDFMSLLVSWVPYVETESDWADFPPDRPYVPSQPFLLPALFLIAAAGVWPAAVSRALKVRPHRSVQTVRVDELIASLEALNTEGRNWTVKKTGTTDLVAEWRVSDRSWQGLFGRAGLSRAKSVRLRLQSSSATVKAVEQRYVVAVEGRWSPDAVVSIGKRRSFSLDLLGWLKLPAGADSASQPVDPEEHSARL